MLTIALVVGGVVLVVLGRRRRPCSCSRSSSLCRRTSNRGRVGFRGFALYPGRHSQGGTLISPRP